MTPQSPGPQTRWLPWLILLLTIGGILRLLNLAAPPLDFHPTRQLRNALVARAIYYESDKSADPELRALAQSFRRAVGQYEPPIIETIVGKTFLVTGGESFAVARVYGTIFWLLAGVALFDLCRRIGSPVSGLIALAYYLLLPFGVQASRSFQPDPLMTVAFVISIYCLWRWSERKRWLWALLGAAFGGLAILVKIVIVFLLVGGTAVIVLTTLGRRFWRSIQVWTMFILLALPASLYYLLAHPGRSTEYFLAWTADLIGLIGSLHFYADWMGFAGSLMGLTILGLAVTGTFLAAPRARWLLLGLWAGYLLYGLTLPFQMYTHSYYHLQLIPIVGLGLVPILEPLVARIRELARPWQVAALLPLLVLATYQAWAARSSLTADDFGEAPQVWRTIGEAVPKGARVIALTQDYGFDLMYWGWRKVQLWPLNTRLSEVRNDDRQLVERFDALTAGNDYFLVTAFGQLESQPALAGALDHYHVAAEGEGYILYNLNSPK